MANNVQYTIGFKADSSQAKKALQDLNTQLEKLKANAESDLGISSDLSEAAQAANLLQENLSKAFNQNTGKWNFSDLNKSLQSNGTSVTELSRKFLNCGATGQDAFLALSRAVATMEIPITKTTTMLDKMMVTLKNTVKWELSSTFVHGLERGLSSAINYAKDLNSSLNDIRIVTGYSADDMTRFAQQANKAAKELSTTTKAYTDASLIYFQQGDNAEMVAKKAAITTKAANVAFSASAEEMSEMLTAVWNSYQVGEAELEKYVDIMAALGAATASSTEEIATAMQKVAATANAVGVSMEQMSSIIATVASVTREAPESIGTSFKTILARIGDLKVGKTLEDGMSLGTVSSQLAAVGVNILDTTGELKEMGRVIEELMGKWQGMTLAEKTAVAQAVAGKRQYTQLMALMENQDMYQKSMNIAGGAEGTLQKQADIQAESWEATSKKLKASLEGIYQNLIPEKGLISATKAMSKVLDIVNEMIKGLGGLQGIVIQVGSALATAFSSNIAASMSNVVSKISGFVKSFDMIDKDGRKLGFKDKVKSLFTETTEQRKYKNDNSKLQEQIREANDNSAISNSTKQQLNMSQMLLSKRLELLAVEKDMSVEQKAASEEYLNNLSKQAEKIAELKQEQTDYNSQLERQKRAVKELGDLQAIGKLKGIDKGVKKAKSSDQLMAARERAAEALMNGSYSGKDELQDIAHNALFNGQTLDMSQYSGATKNLDALIDRFVKLEGAAENIAHARAAFEQFINIDTGEAENGVKNLGEQLQVLKDSLAEKGMNTSGVDNLIEKFNKLSDEEKKQPGALKEIIDGLAKLQDTASSGVSQAITFMADKLGIPKEKLIELRDSADLTEDQIIALANAMRTLGAESERSFEVSSFQKNAKKVIQAISGMTSSWSSFSNLVANWDDSSFTSKATGILSTVTNIAGRFLSGDIVGGIGAVIGAGLGWITGHAEAQQKKLQEEADKISKDISTNSEKSNNLQTESNNVQSLLKNYNQLYERYLDGENIQDELAASAKALGEAYGITGASIATMTGNYNEFNKSLAETLKISELIDENQTQIQANKETWNAMANNNKSGYTSKNQYMRRKADDYSEEDVGKELTIYNHNNIRPIDNSFLVDQIVEAASMTDYPLASDFAEWASDNGKDSSNGEDLLEYSKSIAEQIFSILTNQADVDYGIYNRDSTTANVSTNDWVQFLQNNFTKADAQGYIDKLVYDAIAMYSSIGVDEKGYAIDIDNTTLSGFLSGNVAYFSDDNNMDDFNKYLDEQHNVYWDKNSTIEQAYATFEDYKEWDKQLAEDITELQTQLDATTDEKEKKDLQTQIDDKQDIRDQLKNILENSDYQTLFSDYGQNLLRETTNAIIQKNLSSIVAKNEKNTGFDDFTRIFDSVAETVRDKGAEVYKELEGLDPEKDAEEYDAAVRKITMGLIEGYTSFDDYVQIYVAMAEYFTDSAKFDKAKKFINDKGITSASDIDATLLWAMQKAMDNGADLNTDNLVTVALKANQDRTAANDSKTHYEKMKSSAETLKKDMSLDDAAKLYSAYWDGSVENIMAWEDFVKLDYEEREAYLSNIIDKSLDVTKKEQEEAVKSAQELKGVWQKTFDEDYGKDIDNWTTASDALALFNSQVMDNYQLQKDGSYKFIGQNEEDDKYSAILNSEDGGMQAAFSQFLSQNDDYSSISGNGSPYTVKGIQAFNKAVQEGKTLENNLQGAEAILNGLDLIGEGPQSSSEIISRTTESIHTLNQEFSEFAKTGKLSAKAMQIFKENGINPKDIQTTKDYLDNMQKILNIQKNAIKEQKTNYATKNNGIAYNPNKIWTQEEIDKDPTLYEAWVKIGQAEMDVKDLQDEIFSTMASRGAEVLSELEAKTNKTKEDAEKFNDAANVMSSAIATGELSFSDQQILAQVGYLDAWNKTTNAIQRATLANKAFSEYAGKNATAGQKMAAVYQNAEQTLDGLSKQAWLWKDDQRLMPGWTGNEYNIQTKEGFIGALSDSFKIDDDEVLGAVNKAWDTLKQNGFDFEKATNAEITQAIMDQLNEMGIDADNAWKQILANAKDAMKNIGSQLAQEHIDAAQDAVDAWVDAFNKIADARQTLLEGGNLLKDIAGSPETILQYAKSAGMSPSEITAAIMGGILAADNLSFQNYNDYISQSMAKYGLDQLSASGSYKFGTLNKDMDWNALGYLKFDTRINEETKEKEYKNYKTGEYVSESVIQGQLKNYYAAILKTTGLTEEEAELKAQQIIDGKFGYDTLSDATKKLIEAIYGSADAQKQYQEQIEAETQIQKNADTNNWYSKKENGYEAKYSDLQKLQQAIENAQEAKNNDKSWDTLDKSDRDILEKYGIDFSNVDSAAISCANALLACAEAALALAKANANNQGFYENKYGEYQKAVSRDEYIGSFTSDDDKKAAGERWDQWSKAQGAEYTSDGKLFIGEANSNITDSIAQIQETVDNLSSFAEKTSTNNLTKMAESVSMTKDEFIQYTEAMKEAGEITAKTTEGQYKQAQSLARVQKGLKSIRDNSKEWSNALKKNAGDVVKCNKTLSEMRGAFEEVLDVPVGSLNTLSEEFMTSAETAKLLEAAMDGDVDAYNKLQAKVAEQLLIGKGATISPELQNAIDTIATEMDNLPVEEPIEFGKNAQISPQLYNALNSYVAAVAAAGGDVQAAAAALGFDLEYEEKDVPIDLPGVKYTAGASVYDPATKTTYTNITPHENNGKTTWKGFAIKTITNKGTRGGNIGGHKAPSSGGGGGGGGKAKKIDKKDPEDEKERYHHVNKVLERLSNQFDEIDKKKSRVYGKSYLDYISKEIDLTEKQCDAYQRYIDEAKEYLALDTQRVASLGATFDEFGNIKNYDQVMDNIIGKYNEFVDRYNAMSASEQEAAEEEKTKWDEWYEEKKKWIENYEETVSTIYEQQNNLLEAQNKISEKTLEGIQYKVEIHVDMTDAEKDFLDYLNDTYDELLEKQGDVMNNLVRETELATSNLDALGQSKEELDAAFASGKLNQADYVEGLKDINEQILDNLSNIQDLKKEIEELYGNTLEMASDAFDEQTEKVKNASEAMSSYISILGLIGKGSNLKDLTKFYDSQYEYNLQSLEMQKEYLDILRSEEQYYLDRMNSAEGLTETERQQYEDLEKTIADVNSNILSDTESTLNQITEAFNNEIEIIFKDLEERIAGVGNSIQDLADAYSYYQEEQSRYVTSARELYEVNKLNRQIEKTMNETSSKVNKNLLAALQDRINKQSELNELTEYDIEMNQLQYELLLKKIALEEAQNAKSTVRLTRDSGGNYVYQYTADQDNIMTKQQEYEDVLQKINDLAVNRVQDLESQLLEIYQNTLSKIKEIAQDQTLTEEEKYDKIQTIMNQFKEQTNFIQEQYQIASDNLITSNLAISEHYGQQLVEHSENAKNGLNQTIAAMIEDTEGLQQALENACANQIPAAMDTMQSRIDAVTAAVNLDYNSMSESVTNYNKVTKDAYDQTNKTADNLSKELLPAIHNATTAWDTYVNKLKNVIDIYESMYQAILKTIQAQAKLSNATAPSAVKSSGSGKFSDTTSPSANSNSIAGSGGGSGSSGSSGAIGSNTQYTFITYKATTRGGKSTISGGLPTGPSKLAVGSTGSLNYNPSPNFIKVGQLISDPSKLSIVGKTMTALAAGSVVVTVQYQPSLYNGGNGRTAIGDSTNNLIERIAFATGGLADFTGPAWMDGSKSRPEMVLNPEDTKNILTAVQGVRALDASTLNTLNKYIANASLAMSFGLGNISAGSVYGATDTIQQEVHITAEFPNATNSAEIQDAFDNIINRATQYITTKR